MTNCNKCGADREVLASSLQGNSMNRDLAYMIAVNCPACSKALNYLLCEPEPITIEELVKLDKLPNHRVKVIGG